MSVQSYLDELSSKLVLNTMEKDNINRSINTLDSRLKLYFEKEIKEQIIFGSYSRGTILPRKADDNSDVDYLIIFDNIQNYKPETFLNKLKKFVEVYYGKSEIYRSFPTTVLELNHIKFELVPAYKTVWGSIYIPSTNSYSDWMITDPKSFNTTLTNRNTNSNNLIKPLIRLIKYWNSLSGYPYKSFELESWIVNSCYSTNNIKTLIYEFFDKKTYTFFDSQNLKDKLDRAKKIISNAKYYENNFQYLNAENEIKKLFPEI